MWRLVIIASFTISVVHGQNSRRPEPYDNGHGWDIRLAVPGEPGGDYPTLNSIPRTSFTCSGKTPGYYADVETSCQVFKVCTLGSTYGFQSFLCPNGTLFNQAVFVCDWWMNVNCDRSRLLFNNNNEQFGNLKLGPQLMKDIKKMLTHPMRAPYDKAIMKNNLIVMQEYRPPSGQLFPNGALIAGPERSPNNIYVPAKQKQAIFPQNSFNQADLNFAASTPSSQYVPSSFNAIQSNQGETEFFQRQRQKTQFIQNGQTGTFANGHASELTRPKNSEYFNTNRNVQPPFTQNQNQNQKNVRPSQATPQNFVNQSQRQTAPYINNNPLVSNPVSKTPKEIDTKQQYNYNFKQNSQVGKKIIHPQFLRGPNAGREAKQNLVSPNTVVPTGKTLKFSRIVQKSSSGNPKSRITFKTWIVRPSKSARQLVEPSSYSYDKPSNPFNENVVIETSNLDEAPTTERGDDNEGEPYVYNPPTPAAKQIVSTVEEAPQYLPPTTPVSSLPNRIYSTPRSPAPTRQSIIDLAPTTYKPASRFYVPPSENNLKLSRQYLSPNLPTPQTINYQSARLIANPTSPALDLTTVISTNKNKPSFSLTKQSVINTNHNNLTFADILTKEKLDITVNDIVKNTKQILKTATPEKFNQYRQNIVALNNNYLSPEPQSFETLTPQSPTISKSERIIATPSTDLEPPIETSSNVYQNFNKLSNLPYFKEPAVPTNTIERTVSLKITIPETIAEYLFTNHSHSDNLEILNTGSSSYLVLTNNHFNDRTGAGLIPIGKLTLDKNSNNFNSQALVYSFLADSINAAKQYNNIAKQNVISSAPSPKHSQIQNINNEDLGAITDKISQLTSSQYAKTNQKNANLVSLPQKTTNNGDLYRDSTKYTANLLQRQMQNHQAQNSLIQLYSSPSQNSNHNNLNLPRNPNQIYSGQLYKLPVPEVTRQIYNSPNLAQSGNARRETNEAPARYSQRDTNQNTNYANNLKQSNTDVEVVRSQTFPYAPARLQYTPTIESTQNQNSDKIFVDNFFDSNTGITAQLQDKITGTLPHPLEENKLVTYNTDKSYYLYTKLEENNDNVQNTNTISQSDAQNNAENAKLTESNDLSDIQRVTFELFPSIGYEIEDEREKQQILNALKITELRRKQTEPELNGKIESYTQRQDDLGANIDYTILHPTSNRQVEKFNNANTILYRGPSSYLAPQSSVGSLGTNQQRKSNGNSRLEQFEENNNNGYSKAIPSQQFTF